MSKEIKREARRNGDGAGCLRTIPNPTSNYDLMKRKMEKEFLKYNQDAMIRKFRLRYDAEYLYTELYSREYRIGRTSGKVTWSEDDFCTENVADYEDAMTLYDILCNSKEDCHPAGVYVNMLSLSSIKGGSMSLGTGLFKNKEASFDQKEDALAAACIRLNGVPYGKGDVAYKIPMFGGMNLVFQFWNSDEEFPASLQLMMDKNILQYMRYETMWFAVMHFLNMLEV